MLAYCEAQQIPPLPLCCQLAGSCVAETATSTTEVAFFVLYDCSGAGGTPAVGSTCGSDGLCAGP